MIAFLLAAALQAPPPPPPTLVHAYDELLVYFGPGPEDIRAHSAPAIGEAVRQIALYKPRRIMVQSHTDTLGSVEDNMRLSARRAEIVKAALIKAGVPADLIELQPRGESQPAVMRGDETAEPLNNRVVVVLRDVTIPRP
jgi:outer membrane protein OmpA-like peptidoglycan-associated protein